MVAKTIPTRTAYATVVAGLQAVTLEIWEVKAKLKNLQARRAFCGCTSALIFFSYGHGAPIGYHLAQRVQGLGFRG